MDASIPPLPHPSLARIAYFMRSELHHYQLAQARELSRRYGCELHLYCGDAQQVAYYRRLNKDGLFASISHAEVLLTNALAPVADEAALMERARDYERRIGMTINRLAVANRHLGRGYALGAYHFPLSRYAVKSSYAQMVQGFTAALTFWEREFEEKRITLVMNGLREAAAVARMKGIPFRYMIDARYNNTALWMHDEYDNTPDVEETFRRGDAPPVPPMDKPYSSHVSLSASYRKDLTLSRTLKRIGYMMARQAYWRLRSYSKGKSYYVMQNARLVWRGWSELRRLRRIAQTRIADLEGQRFVYYPLHFEPERALQGISPEYFYQLACIAAVSRDLPAGVRLAVKDQFYGVAARPDNFYEQIAQLKNVVMLDPFEPGIEVVRRADAVVTICGTSGFEAAVMGKPVIAFGRHNLWNFLPHVRTVTDESELPRYLAEALEGGVDPERARVDGQRFLDAVVASAFDMGSYDYVQIERFEEDSIGKSIDALERSFRESGKTAALHTAAAR